MDERYARSTGSFWREYGEAAIVSVHRTDARILLNGSGAAIWSFLGHPRTITEIASFLRRTYGLHRRRALRDVKSFISSLMNSGAVRPASARPGAARDPGGPRRDRGAVMRWAARNIVPISVHVEITRHCNLHCRHCYLSGRSRQFMGRASFQRILEQLKDSGTLFLALTGGEPLLHPGLRAFLDAAVSTHGFSVSILTNGAAERKDAMGILRGYPLRAVHVTLFSLDAAIHDGITSSPGSHRRAVEFIRAARGAGMEVVVKTPLFKQTIKEAVSLRTFATGVGANWSGGPLITPRDDADLSPADMRASPRQLVRHFHETGSRADLKLPADSSKVGGGLQSSKESPLACLALSNSCFIDVRGDLYPCSQVRRKIGNVLETPFSGLWSRSPALGQIREMRVCDLKECRDCDLLRYCTRCPGIAELEGGDISGPSPFECLMARCRREAASYEGTKSGKRPQKDAPHRQGGVHGIV